MVRHQRPDNRPVDARYETKLKSLGDVPGYGSHLPKCFPYRVQINPKTAADLVSWLSSCAWLEPERGPLWYAVTGHPYRSDEWVYLWLSKPSAEVLVSKEFISPDHLEETLRGRG